MSLKIFTAFQEGSAAFPQTRMGRKAAHQSSSSKSKNEVVGAPSEKSKGSLKAQKPKLSKAAIRQRAMELKEKNQLSSTKSSPGQLAASDALNQAPEGESSIEGPKQRLGDVIMDNDPSSGEVQEKLKSLLGSGAISFGDKEKSVLKEILKG